MTKDQTAMIWTIHMLYYIDELLLFRMHTINILYLYFYGLHCECLFNVILHVQDLLSNWTKFHEVNFIIILRALQQINPKTWIGHVIFSQLTFYSSYYERLVIKLKSSPRHIWPTPTFYHRRKRADSKWKRISTGIFAADRPVETTKKGKILLIFM